MTVHHERIEIQTNGKGTYEITEAVQKKIDQCGVHNGMVTVFVQHTSCSLTMMENAAPAARKDVERFFDQLVPETAHYEHDDEGPDDMPSHIRMVLTQASETIPIIEKRLQLGTWQGIFVFEHRRAAHRREILLTIIGQ